MKVIRLIFVMIKVVIGIFIYDDGKIFETESVYVYRLNQLGLEDWLEIGRKFINKVTEENK